MKVDYRTKAFVDKFNSVFPALGEGKIQDIVSFKMREPCVNSSEYHDFIKRLTIELGLHVSRIDGQFQGNAYLVADRNNNSLIFVEHETGPEILANILYVSGVIGLIQQVVQLWGFTNGRFMDRRHYRPDGDAEIRTIDNKNRLIEERMLDRHDVGLKLVLDENVKLAAKVAVLENKLNKIEIQSMALKKRSKKSAPSKFRR